MAEVERIGYKHVRDSHVTSTYMLRHEDINGSNRLFGGRLMEWIDDIAGIAARLHCGGNITTLEFHLPAYLNDIVILDAWVTHVERTSMEVRVDTFVVEPSTGERHLINHAYLTEVCVDKNDRPTPIPWGLVADTDAEHEECENARKRAEIRKMRRAQGI